MNEDIYRVVKIVSPYSIVINGGSDVGLRKGQRFVVYELGEMIVDPETGDELEQLEVIRGTGRIAHVQERIATIESDMKEERPVTIKRKSSLGSMKTIFGDTEETEINRSDISFHEPQVGDLARIYSQ